MLVDVSFPKLCPNMDMRGKGDRLWFTWLECAYVHSQHVCIVPCTVGAMELRTLKEELTFVQIPVMYCCFPHMYPY